MRIWDVPVSDLCRKHLLGEHRELHGLWNILTLGKSGYRNHPETKRWVGRLCHLAARHEEQVKEVASRGWNHRSPLLDIPLYNAEEPRPGLLHTLDEQRVLLLRKNCDCYALIPDRR